MGFHYSTMLFSELMHSFRGKRVMRSEEGILLAICSSSGGSLSDGCRRRIYPQSSSSISPCGLSICCHPLHVGQGPSCLHTRPLHGGCCGQGGMPGRVSASSIRFFGLTAGRKLPWLCPSTSLLSRVILRAVGKYPNSNWVAAITRDLLSVSLQWPLGWKRPELTQWEKICSASG